LLRMTAKNKQPQVLRLRTSQSARRAALRTTGFWVGAVDWWERSSNDRSDNASLWGSNTDDELCGRYFGDAGRILTVLPSLTDEERQRVAEHIKGAEPSYETVILAVQAKK